MKKVPFIVYIYISSQVKIYSLKNVEPESPGNYYDKLHLEAERIQKRDQEVEKQFDKRYKIRKHGCQYLSLITDLMTGNQNYGIRTIEQEFQMLVDLHTGTGLSVHPVRDVRPARSFGSFRPRPSSARDLYRGMPTVKLKISGKAFLKSETRTSLTFKL